MSTAMIDALQTQLGPYPMNGPAILDKLVSELVLKGTLKSQLTALLEGWDKYRLTVSPAAAASFTSWIAQCSVMVDGVQATIQGGAIKTNPVTAEFWKALQAADALLDNAGAVRQWGETAPTKSWRYIAQKFENDHLVADKKAARGHAIARLGNNANVPASTSIEEVYAEALSKYVGTLNDAGVFTAVETYLNTVKGWSVQDAKVDSIAWLTNSPLTAWTFKRKSPSVDQGTKTSGCLMFAVQADENDGSVRLLYHYTSVEPDPDHIARTAPGAAWERVEVEQVIGKLKKLEPAQQRKLRENWPYVYYSA